MCKAYMIQQSTQQGSTIILLAKREKRNPKPLDAIFIFPFVGNLSTKSTKSTRNKQSQNAQITNHMKKEDLIPIIAQHEPLLANAVSSMIDYIQDKWAAPYPTKGQTEAVNAYLHSVHADGDGTMSKTNISHRRLASQRITISAIRVLDSKQLDRLQDVLNRIAADKHYYMPERKRGMGW